MRLVYNIDEYIMNNTIKACWRERVDAHDRKWTHIFCFEFWDDEFEDLNYFAIDG